MQKIYTLDEIKVILAGQYRSAYEECHTLENLAAQAAKDGDQQAYAVISRRAKLLSQYIAGIRDAAKPLGIGEDEFMAAVNQDRSAGDGEGRKEGTECKAC